MTRYQIVGVSKPIQRTSKSTGAVYSGRTISFVYASDNTDGVRCKEHFVMEKALDGYIPKVDDEVYIVYGQSFGNNPAPVDGLILAK